MILKQYETGNLSVTVNRVEEQTDTIIDSRPLTKDDLAKYGLTIDNDSKDPNILNHIVNDELESSNYTKQVDMFTLNIKRSIR